MQFSSILQKTKRTKTTLITNCTIENRSHSTGQKMHFSELTFQAYFVQKHHQNERSERFGSDFLRIAQPKTTHF